MKLISLLQVKVLKGNLASAKVYVPTSTVKKASNSNRTESQVIESVESAAVPEPAPDSVGNPESNDSNEEGTCFCFNFCTLFYFFYHEKFS